MFLEVELSVLDVKVGLVVSFSILFADLCDPSVVDFENAVDTVMVCVVSERNQHQFGELISETPCNDQYESAHEQLECPFALIEIVRVQHNKAFDSFKFFRKPFSFHDRFLLEVFILQVLKVSDIPQTRHVGLFCNLKVRVPERLSAFGHLVHHKEDKFHMGR